MSINEIMEKYTKGEISMDVANEALKEAGAEFHLEPAQGGWTETEKKEGFMPGEKAEVLPDRPDMSRRKDLAGQTVIQRTKAGQYAVTYAEDGYALKAVKQ